MTEYIYNFFKERLITKLSKLSIKELIIKMSHDSYFFPYNISKLFFGRYVFESGKQITWFAYRQAETISDINNFELLKGIIENPQENLKHINSSYFILGHLCRNTGSKDIFDYLTNKLSTESTDNKRTILVTLEECQKPLHYNLDAIYHILKVGTIESKTEAAISLKHSINPLTEELLINSFKDEKNKHLQEMIACTLGSIGTEKSIVVLKEKLKGAKGIDFKYFITQALEDINNRIGASQK